VDLERRVKHARRVHFFDVDNEDLELAEQSLRMLAKTSRETASRQMLRILRDGFERCAVLRADRRANSALQNFTSLSSGHHEQQRPPILARSRER
jgi:hypothetical protein